ncbi:exodeoxyribonuclease V subunit alpha [Acinetobacter sp. WZC-1]|uniref:exodeoxyribonuclease V subunit alpha n=1 Tax=Acinetobacter sp. WZC-1 TaxID=3459034 RepID=UPI00403D689C
MDNSEDNCVENQQDLTNPLPQWIEDWSQYMLGQLFTGMGNSEDALEMIRDLLLATTRGDSCIEYRGKNIQAMQQIAVSDQVAEQRAAPFVYDDQALYLYRYWHQEQRLAIQVARLKQQQTVPVDIQPFEHLLEDIHQRNALKMVAENALNLITGGPGTGKTYTLARIIAVLNQAIPDLRIALAAPTGKAAQRMKEALQNSLNDPKLNDSGLVTEQLKQQETLTIHRLLGLGHRHRARFNQKQPLPFDVIVIDEASMLDLNLATLLLEAVPEHCRLILLGDADQLASVDVGSVLADLQQVPGLQENSVQLVTSRRFREGALIGTMARFIQAHKYADTEPRQLLSDFEQQVTAASEIQPIHLQPDMSDIIQLQYLPKHSSPAEMSRHYQILSQGYLAYFDCLRQYTADHCPDQVGQVVQAFDQYRILAAIHYGPLGVDHLNLEMEKALFEHLPATSRQGNWYVGRPVMMSYNDYQLGLSNGDIGICLPHRSQPDQFEVYFPGLDQWIAATRLPGSVQTAFALTIHKSQGSEFTHTAVVLDEAATGLLSQELIYTAITRARQVVSLLVHKEAFAQSLSIATIRQSGLARKINAGC